METSPDLRLQPDPARYTLPRFLEDVCLRHADRCALRFAGSSITYAELRSQARAWARGLVGLGVVKGARVALLMGNRPEWVVSAFAVSMTGAVLVPVNTFATPDELDYVLRHSDASLLLLQSELLGHHYLDDLLRDHPALTRDVPGTIRCEALPQLRAVVCLDLDAPRGAVEPWSAVARGGGDVSDAHLDAIAAEIAPSDDALIIYTSGTTARPKGILHSQRAPVIQSWRFAESMDLGPEDRVWTAQPFFWTAGLAMSLGASLAAGARLILQEHFDPAAALACIEAERATTLFAWPHQEKSMAEHPSAAHLDLSSVRRVEFSSPLAPLVGLEKDDWGTYGAYGLSETFTIASSIPARSSAGLRRETSGRPLPGNVLRIVDPESGAPVTSGEEGEIAVKGLTFMRGYYKVEPELYLDDQGFFRTQDGGHLDAEGYLHWSGRLSNLIKTGGANVSPAEIEAALGRYAGLKAAHAVGVPHPSLGEAIVLCAIPVEGAELDADALRTYLRQRLSAYKVPRRILVFRPGEVSYTGNQKVQLDPLREAALAKLEDTHTEIAGFTYGGE